MRAAGLFGWLLVLIAGAALVMVVGDFVFAQRNRSLQAEVGRRQQFIAESARLARADEALIRTIATTAAANNDGRLRDLLWESGVTAKRAAGVPPGAGGAGGIPAPAGGARDGAGR